MIAKRPAPGGVSPNLRDYAAAVSSFSWDQARRRLDGLPGGVGLNIAYPETSNWRSDRSGVRARQRQQMSPPVFAPIAGGWFTMGTALGHEDERPPHRVYLDPFELGVYPVTRAEYERFVSDTSHDTPCDWLHQPFTRADLPVVGVSWQDAVAYCAWRSGQDGQAVRLPTEAEWECAARGRQHTLYPWGEGVPDWIPDGGRGPLSGPWPVTLGDPNDFGLFGIATNVHEWCADWHDKDYYSRSPEPNPAGPDRGRRRAARGGAWRHAHTFCRVTLRSKLDPSFRYNDFGFRLARSR